MNSSKGKSNITSEIREFKVLSEIFLSAWKLEHHLNWSFHAFFFLSCSKIFDLLPKLDVTEHKEIFY